MKFVKILVIVLLVYVGIVVLFESSLGYFQPERATTLRITTQDDSGNARERVVARLETDGKLYIAANHWPRRWYREVLAHPDVKVAQGGKTQAYVAVPVAGDEADRVYAEHPLGPVIRILTGFPPRRLVRLDPS